jgi:hypothetical protein
MSQPMMSPLPISRNLKSRDCQQVCRWQREDTSAVCEGKCRRCKREIIQIVAKRAYRSEKTGNHKLRQTGVYVPLQNEGATGLYGWPVYAYVESAVAVGTNPIARIEKASAAAN